jgi:hypothetical protein
MPGALICYVSRSGQTHLCTKDQSDDCGGCEHNTDFRKKMILEHYTSREDWGCIMPELTEYNCKHIEPALNLQNIFELVRDTGTVFHGIGLVTLSIAVLLIYYSIARGQPLIADNAMLLLVLLYPYGWLITTIFHVVDSGLCGGE